MKPEIGIGQGESTGVFRAVVSSTFRFAFCYIALALLMLFSCLLARMHTPLLVFKRLAR